MMLILIVFLYRNMCYEIYKMIDSVLSSILLWLGKLDHVIYSQYGDGSLGGEFQGLNLGHRWLNNTVLQIISDLSYLELET